MGLGRVKTARRQRLIDRFSHGLAQAGELRRRSQLDDLCCVNSHSHRRSTSTCSTFVRARQKSITQICAGT
jgi:hypothetical protein